MAANRAESILNTFEASETLNVFDAIVIMDDLCDFSEREVFAILNAAFTKHPVILTNEGHGRENITPLIKAVELCNFFAVKWLLVEKKPGFRVLPLNTGIEVLVDGTGIPLPDNEGASALNYAVNREDNGSDNQALEGDARSRLSLQRQIEDLLLLALKDNFNLLAKAIWTANVVSNLRFIKNLPTEFFGAMVCHGTSNRTKVTDKYIRDSCFKGSIEIAEFWFQKYNKKIFIKNGEYLYIQVINKLKYAIEQNNSDLFIRVSSFLDYTSHNPASYYNVYNCFDYNCIDIFLHLMKAEDPQFIQNCISIFKKKHFGNLFLAKFPWESNPNKAKLVMKILLDAFIAKGYVAYHQGGEVIPIFSQIIKCEDTIELVKKFVILNLLPIETMVKLAELANTRILDYLSAIHTLNRTNANEVNLSYLKDIHADDRNDLIVHISKTQNNQKRWIEALFEEIDKSKNKHAGSELPPEYSAESASSSISTPAKTVEGAPDALAISNVNASTSAIMSLLPPSSLEHTRVDMFDAKSSDNEYKASEIQNEILHTPASPSVSNLSLYSQNNLNDEILDEIKQCQHAIKLNIARLLEIAKNHPQYENNIKDVLATTSKLRM